MSDCKGRSTPCEQIPNCDGDWEPANQKKYWEMIGSLIYAMTCTRPDFSWVVRKLSQYLSGPRYLNGNMKQELCHKKREEKCAYSDADLATDLNDSRSTTGYCFSLTESGPIISWMFEKQPTVALSTYEAEYMALAANTRESLYLSQLLTEMYSQSLKTSKMQLLCQRSCCQTCKHVNIRYHYISSAVSDRKVVIEYCPTADMVAEVLTKPVK